MPKFTTKAIERLKPRNNRYEVSDDTGLRVRVAPTGRKSFVWRYRLNGRQKVLRLGGTDDTSLKDARDAMATAQAAVASGRAPGSRERFFWVHKSVTVKEVAEEYLEHHARRLKSGANAERILNQDVIPYIGDKPAADITRRDIVELLDRVGKRGDGIYTRVRSIVTMMFRVGVERGLIEDNPAHTLPKRPKKARERVLTDAELAVIWYGIEKTMAAPAMIGMIRFLTLTGLRVSEAAGARWGDVRDGVLAVSSTKTGNAHYVPLSAQALAVIEAVPAHGDHIFSTYHARRWRPIHTRSVSSAPRYYDHFGLPHWTIHDLRRTFRTGLARLGIAPHIAERAINHAVGSAVSRVYDRHTYAAELREAFDAWGAHVAEQVISKKY
jgi:integrase